VSERAIVGETLSEFTKRTGYGKWEHLRKKQENIEDTHIYLMSFLNDVCAPSLPPDQMEQAERIVRTLYRTRSDLCAMSNPIQVPSWVSANIADSVFGEAFGVDWAYKATGGAE
jgi:hypothetical protein